MTAPRKMTLPEQIAFLDDLAYRCCDRDGKVAAETLVTLRPEDYAALACIQAFLARLAPHSRAVAKIIGPGE